MLYKYVGASTGVDCVSILKCFTEARTFKASAPTTFNDPFEFKIAVDFVADERIVKERFLRDNTGATAKDYEAWRRTLEQSRWSVIQETRAALLSTFGVFCLSEVHDNHLMWSHYASSHRGFCVGFDEKELLGIPGVLGCSSVTYQSEAPVFRFFIDRPDEFGRKAVAYKSSLWAYEREHRVFTEKSGIYYFPPSSMKRVVLGCRAYPELVQYAASCCGSSKDFWFQMCEDFSAYKLVEQPIVENTTYMSSFF